MNKEKLTKEYPLFVRVEEYQHTWLKKEADKKKWSVAKLIRSYINYFMHLKK